LSNQISIGEKKLFLDFLRLKLHTELLHPSKNVRSVDKRRIVRKAYHPGSLGIAISEAVEMAVKGRNTKYSLGSVLDAVLMYQSVIGLEAAKPVAELGAEPDIIIGCLGGGSNFASIAFPFVRKRIKEGKTIRFIAVEPESCPSLTRGELRYDHGDFVGLTPLLHMYTLDMEFVPPSIHAGGLRYYGLYAKAHRGKVKKASQSPAALRMAEEDIRRIPSQGWAEMIRKVYEVDPMVCPNLEAKCRTARRCPKCGGPMKVIAFITDYRAIDRIIAYLKLTFVAAKPPPCSTHGVMSAAP